ncbi:MAG: OsmC family protein [Candidatus Latescibacteria bacterium]|jgi:uncharacterized OsmC-like protein|nr:OsmC family protein [Candidatus Latescibacterota bacterium]
MTDLTTRLIGAGETPARMLIRARGFDMIVDEPSVLGGDDLGPNPVEYVLAGFAGCVHHIGHRIAKEMGFAIERFELEICGNIDMDRLFEDSRTAQNQFEEVDVLLMIDATTDAETLENWVADVNARCLTGNFPEIQLKR